MHLRRLRNPAKDKLVYKGNPKMQKHMDVCLTLLGGWFKGKPRGSHTGIFEGFPHILRHLSSRFGGWTPKRDPCACRFEFLRSRFDTLARCSCGGDLRPQGTTAWDGRKVRLKARAMILTVSGGYQSQNMEVFPFNLPLRG